VVEDEDLLLEFVQEVLESSGYRILTATNAVEAMDVWHQNANEISLVLTDMVMPGGVTGKELAAKLTADKPGLRIIFTSGYSLEVLGMDLEEGVALLQKPYRIPAMLKMVRECLDGAAHPSFGRPTAIMV
jgi:two-component system cell cycle sensor histidine kinase/response regulator CckA